MLCVRGGRCTQARSGRGFGFGFGLGLGLGFEALCVRAYSGPEWTRERTYYYCYYYYYYYLLEVVGVLRPGVDEGEDHRIEAHLLRLRPRRRAAPAVR